MNNSSSEVCNKPKQQQQQQQQQQQSYSETPENISEIEKLYLRIKEDWL